MTYVIVIVVVIFFVVVLKSFSTEKSDSEIKGKQEVEKKAVDFEIPNTESTPEKFLDFIDKTPYEALWQIERYLVDMGELKSVVFKKAISDKSKGVFDKLYYSKILEKIKEGSYDNSKTEIPENYKFVCSISVAGSFISNRKEYILFNINEGDKVELRPEPYNRHDKHAIAFFHDNTLIGYVPAVECTIIRDEIRNEHFAVIADIIYKNDYIDVIAYLYRGDKEHSNPEYYLNHDTLLDLRGRKIESRFLKPKKDAEDLNMFYGKKIVITGEFNMFPNRNVLAEVLYESGADIDLGITEKIDYVIVGSNPGWKKMEKIEELGITSFNEEEIIKILALNK